MITGLCVTSFQQIFINVNLLIAQVNFKELDVLVPLFSVCIETSHYTAED